MPEAIQLTPEQIQEYNAKAAPQPFNPIKDLDAASLADLAVKDKSFDLVNAFRSSPDLHGDPATVSKTAEALDLLEKRGFKFADLPGPKQIGGAIFQSAKGLAKQGWNYLNIAGNAIGGAASAPFSTAPGGFNDELAKDTERRLNENLAGTEEAMTGIAQLPVKAGEKLARAVGPEKTPEQKVSHLWGRVGEAEVQQQRLQGQGPILQTLNQGEAPKQNPEAVSTAAAGDPLSFFTFGKAMTGAGKVVGAAKAALPEGVLNAGAKAGDAASKISEKIPSLPEAGGFVVEKLGGAAKDVGKAVETVGKVAEPLAPLVGAGVGLLEHSLGAGGGAGLAVKLGAPGITKLGKSIQAGGESLANFGKGVSGEATGAYSQAAKDILQSTPGVAGEIAKGAALDLGLAAATSETPQDTQGAAGFGTALGAFHGIAKAGRHVVSGQLIAPRDYGINKIVPSSGQFKSFDAMTRDALSAAEPGVKARLNAVREFVKGAAPGTDVFLGKDSTAIENALLEHGVSPETAKAWSEQKGFFTADLPGEDGSKRRVIVLNDPDSAPHEALHAFQDVLGEAGNREVDRIVRESYSPEEWNKIGEDYARKLTGGDLGGKTWQEVILDKSGWGLNEAKEQIYDRVANQLHAENGMAPNPAHVEQIRTAAVNTLGDLMDKSVQNNQHIDPNQVGQHVWREVLSPEQATAAADRYIAREIAAENFDALFKHTGASLKGGNQIPEKLARVVGKVVSALGGNPLEGRTSEAQGIPLKTPIVESLKGQIKSRITPAAPVVAPAAPKTPGSKKVAAPITPDDAAKEAEKIAADAPDIPVSKEGEEVKKGTASPQEILGKVAEAIANRKGIKINYLSAPDEPAAATTSNREARRAIIETFRSMPASARSLWEKTFFPDRVLQLKDGSYQILGWSPEVFAANAHKMAEFLVRFPDLSPYEIDAKEETFTADAWKELYSDVETFVKNHKAGMTGAGEELVVPKLVSERGFYAPAKKVSEAEALPQNKADFINLLFNFRLPDSPRITKGKLPLNIAGQEISEATKPGRVQVPVEPRGTFTGAEAKSQRIEGMEIMEVNPLRNEIEAAAKQSGEKMPSLIEAIQRLNLDSIKEVEAAPESPEFRANSLTLTAGFQPGKDELTPTIKAGGKFFTGNSHGEILEKIAKSGDPAALLEHMMRTDAEKEAAKGFLHEGNFVDRKTAADIFLKVTGKTRESLMKPDEGLHSEDTEFFKKESDKSMDATAQFSPKAMNQDDAEDFSERHDKIGSQIVENFLKNESQRVAWPKISAARLKRIWLDFGKTGVVRDEKGLNAIQDQMLDGIARLRFSTDMSGHSQLDPKDILEHLGHDFDAKKIEKLQETLEDENGSWLLSDYGLPKLEKLYADIRRPDSAEDLLVAIDKALNVIHQRNDLAGMFVEGGTKTLNEIASQGGYTSEQSAQFSPKEVANEIKSFSPAEFSKWVETSGGFTKKAHEIGMAAPSEDFVKELRQTYDHFLDQSKKAIEENSFDKGMILAAQGQFFREAAEAAEGTGSAGFHLRKIKPGYKPPFPPKK